LFTERDELTQPRDEPSTNGPPPKPAAADKGANDEEADKRELVDRQLEVAIEAVRAHIGS
ncbi:MAG: hypothetical protein ACQESR_27790, partial [Planctomycetota bacterium]